jgi:hypothetical protein
MGSGSRYVKNVSGAHDLPISWSLSKSLRQKGFQNFHVLSRQWLIKMCRETQ